MSTITAMLYSLMIGYPAFLIGRLLSKLTGGLKGYGPIALFTGIKIKKTKVRQEMNERAGSRRK